MENQIICSPSSRKSKHVPYGQLGQDIIRFVSEDFLPTGICIKDPRNMHKDDIVQLLQHIYDWQEIHGVTKAFRFSHFIRGDKKFESATYPPGSDPHHSGPQNNAMLYGQPGHLPIQTGYLPIQPSHLTFQPGHLLIQDVRTKTTSSAGPRPSDPVNNKANIGAAKPITQNEVWRQVVPKKKGLIQKHLSLLIISIVHVIGFKIIEKHLSLLRMSLINITQVGFG